MIFIDRFNPLSCDTYINAGNYFQEQLSNHSNLVVRTTLVFAKIVGRAWDALIHTSLGSIKLTASTTMAICSIPAAAFGCIPTHHIVAKQASRHFALALFFIVDIPLSLTHILKKYPTPFCGGIQERLRVSPTELAFDPIIDSFDRLSDNITKDRKDLCREVYKENKQLKYENEALSRVCALQKELIQSIKQIQDGTQQIKAS